MQRLALNVAQHKYRQQRNLAEYTPSTFMVRLLAVLALAASCTAVSALKTVHAASVSNSSDEVPCSQVRQSNDPCAFVKQYCRGEDYLQWYYCSMEAAKGGAWLILALETALLFTTLGICAGDFFAVNLSSIARALKMSDTLAGVTLLALGNGGPDIFSTWAAMSSNSPDLAVGELIGAASFITTVVAGTLPFVTEFRVRELSLMRDALFLFATACLVLPALITGRIQLWHGIAMVSLYIVYVACVSGYHWWVSRKAEGHEAESEPEEGHAVRDEEATRPMERQPLLDQPHPHSWQVVIDHSPKKPHIPAALYQEIGDWRRAHGQCIASPIDYMVQPSLVGSLEYKWRHRLRQDDSRRATSNKSHRPASPTPRSDRKDDRVLSTLFPSLRDLGSRGFGHAVLNLVTAVPYCLLKLTTPVVDNEHDKDCRHGWNRWLLLLQAFIAPQFVWIVIWMQSDGPLDLESWLPPATYCALGSVVFTLSMCVCTSSSKQPAWYPFISVLGFGMSAFWLSTIADEIVSIMKAAGIIFGISQAVLGFTVFAIGNCLDDWVANITVSQHGHSNMAFAACFGGPLLNILLGLGSSTVYIIVRRAQHSGGVGPVELNVDPVLTVSTVVVGVTMIFVVLLLRWNHWQMKRITGVSLISVWVLLTVGNVLLEVFV